MKHKIDRVGRYLSVMLDDILTDAVYLVGSLY